jgi:predicted neutral ceramidase superfamily lipid hydrolase
MQNVSNVTVITALFLPGLWLGLLVPVRHLRWAVPLTVAMGALVCWVRFHQSSADFLLLMVYVPLLMPMAVGELIFAVGSGLLVGYLIRTYVPTLALKAGAALVLTALAAVIVHTSQSQARADKAAGTQFRKRTEEIAARWVAQDPRVLDITGNIRRHFVFGAGTDRRTALPYSDYDYRVDGERGRAAVRIAITGSLDRPMLTITRIEKVSQ